MAERHHDHGHPHRPDVEDAAPTHHQLLCEAVTGLLLDKGIITADALRATLEAIDAKSPADGARLVARAWRDDGFRDRLLTDASAAAAALGIDAGAIPIRAVAAGPGLHHLVVCSLCSCYPRHLLGLPPDWYKARAYRSRAVREPRSVLAEFGLDLPADTAVRVHDSNADLRYFVLPERPGGTAGWREADLAAIVTRDCLIGTARPSVAG